MAVGYTRDIDLVVGVIKEYGDDKFYGTLEIKFEAGKIVLLRKHETIKPQCRDNRVGETASPLNAHHDS